MVIERSGRAVVELWGRWRDMLCSLAVALLTGYSPQKCRVTKLCRLWARFRSSASFTAVLLELLGNNAALSAEVCYSKIRGDEYLLQFRKCHVYHRHSSLKVPATLDPCATTDPPDFPCHYPTLAFYFQPCTFYVSQSQLMEMMKLIFYI